MKSKGVFLVCFVVFLSLMNFAPFLIIPAQATGENWANSNLGYRQSHIISNATGADVSYQIPITIVNGSSASSGQFIYENNRMRSDFGDLLFYSNDNATSLNYWCQNYTSGQNATFWVQMPSSATYGNLTSMNQQIWVYYGNSTMTTASSLANTFPTLSDNMNSFPAAATWINDGMTKNTTTYFSGNLETDTASATDTNTPSAGQYCRSRSSQTGYTAVCAYVYISYLPTSNMTQMTGFFDQTNSKYLVASARNNAGTYQWGFKYYNGSTSSSFGTNTLSLNTWYFLEVRRSGTSGTTYYLYADGVLKHTITGFSGQVVNCTWIGPFTGTTDAFYTVSIDDYFLRSYVDPEPVQSTWGSEETPTAPAADFATVTLNAPVDKIWHIDTLAIFGYTPSFSSAIVNASLWYNGVIVASSTSVTNNTVNSLSYTPTVAGNYAWTVQVFNSSTGIFPTLNGTISVGNTEIRYMGMDTWTVNTKTGYVLNTTDSYASGSGTSILVYSELGNIWKTIYFQIVVFRLLPNGTEIQVPETQTVASGNETGYLNSTLSVVETTSLNSTDAIAVEVWANITNPPATSIATFYTEQLGADGLPVSTWAVYYYLTRQFLAGTTIYTFNFGTQSVNSRIENFTWSTNSAWTLNSQDVTGNSLTNTTLTVSAHGVTFWSGSSPAYVIPGVYNVTAKWLQNLVVNTTLNVDFSTHSTLNLTCLAYPYTVSGVTYWAATNSTITSQSYVASVLQLDFNGTVGTYALVSDCPTYPTYLLNVTYDYATDFSLGYLVLSHWGNATITVSYELWGLNIQKTTHRLISASFAWYTLSLAITGNTGEIGSLEIYCGSWGTPQSSTGFVTISYATATKVLTATYTFASDILATITFQGGSGGGGGGGGGGGDEISLPLMLTAMLDLPQFAFQNSQLNGTVTVTWTGTMQVYFGEIVMLATDANYTVSVPSGLPYTLKLSFNGSNLDTVPFILYIPLDVSVGEHQIPFHVQLYTSATQIRTFTLVAYIIVQPAPASALILPSPNELLTMLFLAMFAMILVTILFRREQARRTRAGY